MHQKWIGLRKQAMSVLLPGVLMLLLGACGENTATTATATTALPTTLATTTNATTSATTVSTSQVAKTVAPVPNGDHSGVTDTEIKLGGIGPGRGIFGFLSTPIRVMDGYFKMINDQGGIYGRKIKYIVENDDFDQVKTQAAAQKLIEQDQVLALSGIRSPSVAELRDYLVQKKMPTLPFITPSSVLYEPTQKLIFGFLPPLAPEARFVVDYAIEQMGAKKLAILYQSDGPGLDALKPFLAEAQTKQASVVAQIALNAQANQDINSLLSILQQSGADFLYVSAGNFPQTTTFLQQANTPATKLKIMLSYYLADSSFYVPLGKAAEGLYSTWFALQPDNDDIKSVQFREFMKKYLPDEKISYLTQEGYIMAQVTVEALRRAGKDLTRESFVAAAESIINWRDSYANNITFGPINRSPINSFYVTQYRDNKIQKISDWYTIK